MFRRKRVLIIDQVDSFVNLLADEFGRRDCVVDVYRSHWPIEAALAYIERYGPNLLVLSPGPGHPEDAGLAADLLAAAPQDLPVFGVCLGHQCIVRSCGGRVVRAAAPVHGRFSRCVHTADGLFRGLPNPLRIGRYHSLIGRDLPDTLAVDATCDGEVMAVHHRERPWWGVQFHPESILTPCGGLIIDNLLSVSIGNYGEVLHPHETSSLAHSALSPE